MTTFFSHLECSVPCGAGPHDPGHPHHVCTCGAPLLARYDLTAAKKWSRNSLIGRDSTMWRYHEILPLLESEKGLDAPVTLGEGWTPLVRARRLGKELGLSRIYVKDESRNPTDSFKARGMSVAVTRALHLGARVLSVPTVGNTGAALAAYAAHAGVEAKVFMPKDARPAYVREAQLYGAEVTHVDGLLPDAAKMSTDKGRAHGWYDLASFTEPYRIEGKKTMGYELAEQLGWQLPDWIVYPTGAGMGLIAMWKAFSEMAALGWIDPVRRPRLVCVQAAGCAPMVRAFGAGSERAANWDEPRTVADGLRVPRSLGDFLLLRALRESSGSALAVGDAEMLSEVREIGRTEGISVSPESGAAFHALRVLAGDGRIKQHDTVVVFNTAGALKSLELTARD